MNENTKVGFVSLVGAGPGDPGLITLRAVESLRVADVVAYDRLANPILLRLAPQAEHIPVGKQPNHHPLPQDKINALLIEKALQGKHVVRLKGGDPFIFGRGGEEAAALIEAGISFEIIPGVTSAIAVPAYAGIPLTCRGIADSAAIITGHRALNIENPEEGWLQGSLGADTLVFLMGVKNIARIVEQLLASGRKLDTPAALVERGTTTAQKTVVGTLENIIQLSEAISPPAIFVVGAVVSLRERLRWFDLLDRRPLFGMRILNTKSFSNSNEVGLISNAPPWDEFDKEASRLGADVIHYPVIEIGPPPDIDAVNHAIQRMASKKTYNWVIFTSVNGVEAFFNQINSMNLDARCFSSVKIGAIGVITAQALKARGIIPDFVPERFTGYDLGEEIPVEDNDMVLLPRSEIALPELPAILAKRGCIVDEVSAYSVNPAPPDEHILKQLMNKEINVVALFSPSGARSLADMLRRTAHEISLSELLAPLTVACIGPTTEHAAIELGIRVDIVAKEHTTNGLVKAVKLWREHLLQAEPVL